MGWFDQQVRQIKKNDQEVFEESIFQMASVVLGRRDSGVAAEDRILTSIAIDEILKYYHFKPTVVPKSVNDREEQIEYCMRPHGIMYRMAELKGDWYKDSYMPLLAYTKEDDKPVALIPKNTSGYVYVDPTTGSRITIDRKAASELKEEATCFYRPLPQTELGIRDILFYMNSCFSVGDVGLFIALTILVTLTGMLSPLVTRALTGPVLESGSGYYLAGTAIFLACAAISTMLINSVKSMGLGRIQTKTAQAVESALMARVMNLPANLFRKYSSGDMLTRITNASRLSRLILENVMSIGITSLASLLYIVQIFVYAPGLTWPAVAVMIITLVINLVTALMQVRVKKAVMEANAKTTGLGLALITGIQKIKLSGSEKRAFAKWAGAYAKEAGKTYDIPLFLKVNTAITTGVSLLGTIMIYYLAVKTGVTASEYMAFNVAYGALMGSFTTLSSVAVSIAEVKPIMEMLEPILKTRPESSENREILTSIKGNIELSNVYFKYKDNMPYVINGMSLTIKAGEYVAVVGTTGCGKSTLMRLLLGFETPEKGVIYYDGRDMSKLDLRSLRRRIGAVTQDGSLFQGDIYSNIVISAPHLTLDDAWLAAEIADIAEDIRSMPMKMATIISEGQGGISGGQKQRLMIARAVAPKPKILMFDEATSALDNKTQKQVSEALDNLKCTRLVIAHRLSTIKHCDRILVLDKGNIAEDGTYDQLIEKGGLFAELVERQRLE
ncbi:MAG: ATP-binding cassette domain-containing protein [Lachnospiraceae bacterium]|nr:ATP-binding cassette domain-containing protein [Lachnospiraceae bacterium]